MIRLELYLALQIADCRRRLNLNDQDVIARARRGSQSYSDLPAMRLVSIIIWLFLEDLNSHFRL